MPYKEAHQLLVENDKKLQSAAKEFITSNEKDAKTQAAAKTSLRKAALEFADANRWTRAAKRRETGSEDLL